MPEPITIRGLLKDPIYKKWFSTPPRLKPSAGTSPPWTLYVQKTQGGGWSRRDCETYAEAHNLVGKNIRKFYDLVIVSKRQAFQPPVVKKQGKRRYHLPDAPGHQWCPYCRRPTVFTWFTKHHAFDFPPTSYEPRCTVCGVRRRFVQKYHR